MEKLFKLVVTVPEEYANAVRQAIGDAGAGRIGNYSDCSFSVSGIGRFKPLEGANPTTGSVGQQSSVPEERIETVCTEEKLPTVLNALYAAHPYEEPAVDLILLEDMSKYRDHNGD